MESQLGDDYNAGDECCALVRGKSFSPLIRFYKATDTIEDRQRVRAVLPIGATRLSFAHNESNRLNLRLSTHGRGVRSTEECSSASNRDDALVRDSALNVYLDEWERVGPLVSAGRISGVCCASAVPPGLVLENRGGPFILPGPRRSRHR